MTAKKNATQKEMSYWEKVALTRWGKYTTIIIKNAILKFTDMVKDTSDAVEVGCEGGRWSKLLTEKGWKMTCTDINEESLKLCQKRVPTANCILVKPEDTTIPCKAESKKLLLCTEVAPVIQSDWFIDEAYRVIEDKGYMVAVAWNKSSFRGIFAHLSAKLKKRTDFYTVSYPGWRKKLKKRGFKILYEEGFCHFPFPRDSNSVLVPLCVFIEKILLMRRMISISPWIVFIAQKH